MEEILAPRRTSLALKLAEAVLAAVAVVNVLLMGLEMVPPEWLTPLEAYGELLLFGPTLLAVLVGVGLAIRWHVRERRAGPTPAGAHWHARLQGVIRYWLAFEIATYGFAKLLQTQFEVANYQLDRPLGTITGFTLTWYYFGYSRPFAIILGSIQIGGAALLLWRRTTLLGALLLLPVLTNIVFINLFYDISVGAFLNSVLFTLTLAFLVALEGPRLRAAFLTLTSHLPPVRLGGLWLKGVVRLMVLAAAWGFIYSLRAANPAPSPLEGVWRVDALTRNGRAVALDSCGTAPDGWTRLYFAGWRGCVFRYHPDKYEPRRELRGHFAYDPAHHQLRIGFQRDKKDVDSLVATLAAAPDRRHARLTGRFGKVPVEVALTRLK